MLLRLTFHQVSTIKIFTVTHNYLAVIVLQIGPYVSITITIRDNYSAVTVLQIGP